MKNLLPKALYSLFASALLLGIGSSQAAVVKVAGERAGHWEAGIMLNFLGGEDINQDLAESKLKNNMGWGLGFHYNFNNHWNLGFDMAFNNPDYELTFYDQQANQYRYIDHNASRFDGQLNAQYNILSGNFTPFIQAGLGWTYMDSNIVESLSYYCGGFYYPWCTTYANTYDDTAFSYNLGVGLRWDITELVFLRASYIQQWVDTDGDPAPQTGRVEVGFMF
jgi:opacity protein-like surface antigen